MKFSLVYLMFVLKAACVTSDRIFDTLNIFDSGNCIGKKVTVLFSPNVYEAYSYKLENMSDIVNNPKFRRRQPTVVYIHGWLEDGEFEESTMAVRSSYRIRNDHNILIVDWSAYSRWNIPIPYKSSISKLKSICEMIAEQLEVIRKSGCDCHDKFYLVGHSLGGQCAGLVGRTLRKISNEKFAIAKLYALDPAGPGFDFSKILGVKGFNCISKDDAAYVQIIHTNGGRLGVRTAVGHSDFFVNGGTDQIGCLFDACNHQRSWVYFQESVRDDAVYLARKCDSYENFLNGSCDENEVSFMGYSSNDTLPIGSFYFKTHPSRYGTPLGKEGLLNRNFILINQDGSSNSETVPFNI